MHAQIRRTRHTTCAVTPHGASSSLLPRATAGRRPTVEIYARDFANKPFVVTSPGHYILQEDVAFEPKRRPEPSDGLAHSAGWIAAVIIKACDVTLDLGGHRLEQSKRNALQDRFLSLILIGSSLFELRTQGPFDMGGSELISQVEHVSFSNFEVCAVQLNRCDGVLLNRLDVGPAARPAIAGPALLQVRTTVNALLEAGEVLTQEAASLDFTSGVSLSAAEVIARLVSLLEQLDKNLAASACPDLFAGVAVEDVAWLSESAKHLNCNSYGIALNGSSLLGGALVDTASARVADDCAILNTRVHGVHSDVTTVLAFKGGPEGEVVRGPAMTIPHLRPPKSNTGGGGGLLLSPLTHAQLLWMQHRDTDLDQRFVSACLQGTPQQTLDLEAFLAHGSFTLAETDAMGHALKGTVGVLCKHVRAPRFRHLHIRDLSQEGSGSHRMGEIVDGVTCAGLALSGCDNAEIEDFHCSDLRSTHGRAVPIIASADSSVTKMCDIHAYVEKSRPH